MHVLTHPQGPVRPSHNNTHQQALVSKFPTEDLSSLNDLYSPPSEPFKINKDIIRKTILGYKKMAAPGPSGMRVEHLQLLFSASYQPEWITTLINKVANGGVQAFPSSPRFRELFFGGTLLGFRKPGSDGQVNLRPVVIGEILDRIISKTILKTLLPDIMQYLGPSQVGVGIKSGAEATIHWIGSRLEDDPSLACLRLDQTNAFNAISRQSIAEAIKISVPELRSWFMLAYGRPSAVVLNTEQGATYVPCSRGVRQGDVLGPALYAMGATKTWNEIRGLPGIEGLAYLDDWTLVGKPETLRTAMSRASATLANIGLELSPSPGKQEVYSHQTETLATHFQQSMIKEDGIVVLGAPVGKDKFQADFCMRKARKAIEKCKALEQLPSLQSQYHLYTKCVIPSIRYLARIVYLTSASQALALFDEFSLSFAKSICTSPHTITYEHSERQLQLPLKFGGGGFVPIHPVGAHCYISGVADSTPIIAEADADEGKRFLMGNDKRRRRISAFCDTLKRYLDDTQGLHFHEEEDLTISKLAVFRRSNKTLCQNFFKLESLKLLNAWTTADTPSRKSWGLKMALRMTSASQPGAQAWLRALPSCPELKLKNGVFKLRLASLCGISQNYELNKSCVCGHLFGHNGATPSEHFQICKKVATHNHDYVKNVISRLYNQAGVPTHLEPLVRDYLITHPDDTDRLDIVAFDIERGHHMVDVSIRCPATPTIVKSLASRADRNPNVRALQPGYVLTQAIAEKQRKYGLACTAARIPLQVFAIEQYGNMSADLHKIIATYTNAAADRADDVWKADRRATWATPSTRSFWYQVISCALQRTLGEFEVYLARRSHKFSQSTHTDMLELAIPITYPTPHIPHSEAFLPSSTGES